MIRCVCLVVDRGDALLLVQVRNRQKYYFPGGKIEPDETHPEALQRELREELGIELAEDALKYIGTVVGPAYPQPDTLTELNCYQTRQEIDWEKILPQREITDLKWIKKEQRDLIAPAVLKWIDRGVCEE